MQTTHELELKQREILLSEQIAALILENDDELEIALKAVNRVLCNVRAALKTKHKLLTSEKSYEYTFTPKIKR